MEKFKKKTMKYVETEVDVFVANDGKQFETEQECLDYEAQLEEREKRRAQLLIPELDDLLPLSNDLDNGYDHTYQWYRVNSKDDFELLNENYRYALVEPEVYPDIICVQEYADDYVTYLLTDLISDINKFLNHFGYQAVEK